MILLQQNVGEWQICTFTTIRDIPSLTTYFSFLNYHKKKKDFDTNLKGFSQIDNGVLTKGNSRLKEV